MEFKDYIIDYLKQSQGKSGCRKILIIDGEDERAIEVARMHTKDKLIVPILLVKTNAEKAKMPDIEVISMEEEAEQIKNYTQKYFEMRNGKTTYEECEECMNNKYYFGTMLLKMGRVDGVIGGLVCPTADTLRPAFRIIGMKKGVSNVSSVMVMIRKTQWFIFTDVSVIPQPNVDQVVEIAINASEFAKMINFKIKLAFLSFSTSGSANHERAKTMREATLKFNEVYKPKYKAIGEIQFDAAFDLEIRKEKYKDEGFEKQPTVFVFPSLESANIGYKIAQRLGDFAAFGPVLTGLAAPVNDLSRGATVFDIYMTAVITALQANKE